MTRFTVLALLSACLLGAQNLIKNPAMKLVDATGAFTGWRQFQKGNLQVPGLDGGDFTLSQPDGKDATITVNLSPARNVPHIFTFEAKGQDGCVMFCYFEWFKQIKGKQVYGGSASTLKQAAPTEWKKFSAPFILPDDFHHGYVAMRSLNGKPLSIRKLSLHPASVKKDDGTGGQWNMDALGENWTPRGVIVRNNAPATLYCVPVEAGKSYCLSYDACGEGPIDPAYPFHEIKVKFTPSMQGRMTTNDVANTPQRKFHKFKVPEKCASRNMSVLFTCATRSPKAQVFFSNLKLEEIIPDPRDEWRFQLVKPFYRDVIFESQALEEMECQLLTDGKAASCVIEFNGGEYKQPVQGACDVRIAVPVRGLANGAYPLVCKVCDNAGAVLKTFEKKILKVPVAPVEVICHENQRLYVNGKPIIMNYMNLRNWSEDYVYYAARHGVNAAGVNLGYNEAENLKKLDLAQKYGIRAIVHSGYADGKRVTAEKFRKRLEQIFTPAVRRHPAFLMYSVVDEPFWGGKPFEMFQMTYEVYREFDPYHPTWINAAPRGEVTDLRPYAEACDVYGCDIYPVPSPNSHSGLDDKMMTSVGKYAQRINEVTYCRKTNFMILQGFGWGENPECGPLGRAKIHPTQAQMRFMLFDAMVSGATDIYQWGSNFVKDEAFLELVFDTCADLRTFSGLFCTGKPLANATSSNAAVRASVWEHQGELFYFIMNLTDADATAEVAVADKPLTDIMGWGNATKANAAGKMTISLKPYGYLVCGTAALPPPLYPLPERDEAMESLGSPVKRAIEHALAAYVGKKRFQTKANWIWQGQVPLLNADVCYIGRQFTVAEGEKVQLLLAVDDVSTVFLNGKELGKTEGWNFLKSFDLTDIARKGENLLMIRAADAGGLPCGVLAELHVGEKVDCSDTSWLGLHVKNTTVAPPASLDGFTPAIIVQPYGGGAWQNNVMMSVK